ncbi:hypothetical protein [Sphingopyxis sp. 550A]
MRDKPDAETIANGLSDAQREGLLAVNPDDVNRFHYDHFKGRSLGLFNVAPGWSRMELSRLGLAVRAILLREQG